MDKFVQCWQCTHYVWFSVNDDNSSAFCELKEQCVTAHEKVCERFMLAKGFYAKRAIPDYCIHYNNETRT